MIGEAHIRRRGWGTPGIVPQVRHLLLLTVAVALPLLPATAPQPSGNERLTGPVAARAASTRPTYAGSLNTALAEMERGRHVQAAAALKIALTIDRNDPCGVLALGTLYLHTGNTARAAREFARARSLAPEDPLGPWSEALAALAQGRVNATADHLDLVSEQEVPASRSLRAYVRLLQGDAAGVRRTTETVTANEADPLLLEIAGFAALRGGDAGRGETLLNALLSRPEMRPLQEERAAILPFLDVAPLQAGAPPLPQSVAALQFPAASQGAPLAGRVTLSPPAPLPRDVAVVTYSVEGGGGYSAAVNYYPWASEWNTTRFPNGLYTVRTSCCDSMGRVLRETVRTFSVWNENAPVSRLLDETDRAAFRKRLLALLTPRASRKAAHFALAERAVTKGNSAAALAHIEAVVAIDPLFQNARASLRKYNRDSLGVQNGIWRGTTTEKLVALTFDDGPSPLPHRTPALLDALKAANAPSTFFVVGLRAEKAPELLQRMDAEGHEVANHSYSHPNLTYLDTVALERELARTSVIIREATGKRPRFYRPPGGNFNTAVVSAAEAMGMAGAYWTVDGVKFENRPFTSQQLTRFILKNVRPGAILLLHNAPENTVAAVPEIVRALRAKGYRLVTMSELARRCKPAAPVITSPKPYSSGG